jgi:hypothetical protein
VPSALDPYVIAYYRLETYDDTRPNFGIYEGEISYESRFEPDPICKCIGTEDFETFNYPKLGHSSNYYFEDILNVPFPKT